MKYEDLTHKIIGCAMEVHRNLGNGFQEVVYQRALSIEMNLQGIVYEREKEMSGHYPRYCSLFKRHAGLRGGSQRF